MRVMVKRIRKNLKHFNPHRLDKSFIVATIEHLPSIEEHMKFQLDRMDDGIWITTPVTNITLKKEGLFVDTMNSTYHLKGL